jgi:hypothetical protein
MSWDDPIRLTQWFPEEVREISTKQIIRIDYEKAKGIYRLGLERVTEDREIILDRLESLEEEKKK